jgi:DNA-binding NarL/FixJ family response regulator
MMVGISDVMTKEKIRALIADDQEAIRSGLRVMLGESEIQIVAEAATGSEAVEAAQTNDIDVAILDIRMPGGDGLYALSRIKERYPELPCLMLSTYDNAVYVERSRMLGAAGYLAKGITRSRLIQSIQLVATGHNLWFDGRK